MGGKEMELYTSHPIFWKTDKILSFWRRLREGMKQTDLLWFKEKFEGTKFKEATGVELKESYPDDKAVGWLGEIWNEFGEFLVTFNTKSIYFYNGKSLYNMLRAIRDLGTHDSKTTPKNYDDFSPDERKKYENAEERAMTNIANGGGVPVWFKAFPDFIFFCYSIGKELETSTREQTVPNQPREKSYPAFCDNCYYPDGVENILIPSKLSLFLNNFLRLIKDETDYKPEGIWLGGIEKNGKQVHFLKSLNNTLAFPADDCELVIMLTSPDKVIVKRKSLETTTTRTFEFAGKPHNPSTAKAPVFPNMPLIVFGNRIREVVEHVLTVYKESQKVVIFTTRNAAELYTTIKIMVQNDHLTTEMPLDRKKLNITNLEKLNKKPMSIHGSHKQDNITLMNLYGDLTSAKIQDIPDDILFELVLGPYHTELPVLLNPNLPPLPRTKYITRFITQGRVDRDEPADGEDWVSKNVSGKTGKLCFLVGVAGMGKTSLLAKLGSYLIENPFFTQNVITYCTCRKVLERYESDSICKHEPEFSFWESSNNGYDDMNETSRKKILGFLKSAKESLPKLNIVLASQTQYVSEFVPFQNISKIIYLQGLEIGEQREFLLNIWAVPVENKPTLLVAKNIIYEAEKVFGKELTSTPFMCRVLAIAFKDKFRDMVPNNNNDEVNAFEIFDKYINYFVKKVIASDLQLRITPSECKLDPKTIDSNSHVFLNIKSIMCHLHRHDAFKNYFSNISKITEALNNVDACDEVSFSGAANLYGLIKDVEFSHNIIADYFIAVSIAKSISSKASPSKHHMEKLIVHELLNKSLSPKYDIILKFLNAILLRDLKSCKDLCPFEFQNWGRLAENEETGSFYPSIYTIFQITITEKYDGIFLAIIRSYSKCKNKRVKRVLTEGRKRHENLKINPNDAFWLNHLRVCLLSDDEAAAIYLTKNGLDAAKKIPNRKISPLEIAKKMGKDWFVK